GERGDDLLDHAVRKILLLWVAAHIGERQHRDRRLVGERQRSLCPGRLGQRNAVDPYRPRDVFDLLLAHVLEGIGQLVANLVPHNPTDADPAGLGDCFQARRYVHTVSEDVVFLNDHVAEIDAYPKPDALLFGNLWLAIDHPALHLDRASHRFYNTWKLDQHPVAGILNCVTPVLLDLRIN